MTSEREKAHDEMRNRGFTDDSHAACDTCGVVAVFWLLSIVTVLASVAGMVTL